MFVRVMFGIYQNDIKANFSALRKKIEALITERIIQVKTKFKNTNMKQLSYLKNVSNDLKIVQLSKSLPDGSIPKTLIQPCWQPIMATLILCYS